VPTFVRHRLCVPENPVALSFIKRACVGRQLLRECRNVLGYRHTHVPLFRFAFLLAQAREFANVAVAAEKDFIAFLQARDTAAVTLLRETQALRVAQSTVSLNRTLQSQARAQLGAARIQVERVELQREQLDAQIEEGRTDYEDQALEHLEAARNWQMTAAVTSFIGSGGALLGGAVGGGVGGFLGAAGGPAGAVAGAITVGAIGGAVAGALTGGISSLASGFSGLAAVESTEAQMAQLNNAIQQRRDELDRAYALSDKDLGIAEANEEAARLGVEIAGQQVAIAQISAQFAADIVAFLQSRLLGTRSRPPGWRSGRWSSSGSRSSTSSASTTGTSRSRG
jgi:hypothetical protein